MSLIEAYGVGVEVGVGDEDGGLHPLKFPTPPENSPKLQFSSGAGTDATGRPVCVPNLPCESETVGASLRRSIPRVGAQPSEHPLRVEREPMHVANWSGLGAVLTHAANELAQDPEHEFTIPRQPTIQSYAFLGSECSPGTPALGANESKRASCPFETRAS